MLGKIKKYSLNKIFKINFFKKKKNILKKKKFIRKKNIKRKKKTAKSILILGLKFFQFYYGNLIKKKFKKLINNKSLPLKILKSLEFRLDIMMYRMQYVFTIFQANNFIKNNFITVNNKIINYPKYKININDLIEINIKKKSYIYNIILYNFKLSKIVVPHYIETNFKTLQGIIIYNPKPSQIPFIKYIPYKLLTSFFKK